MQVVYSILVQVCVSIHGTSSCASVHLPTCPRLLLIMPPKKQPVHYVLYDICVFSHYIFAVAPGFIAQFSYITCRTCRTGSIPGCGLPYTFLVHHLSSTQGQSSLRLNICIQLLNKVCACVPAIERTRQIAYM